MRLTPHFKLSEFLRSNKADELGIVNTPTVEHLANITYMAQRLEDIRKTLGKPISITSGYRNPELNRAVGGVPTSAHAMGLAADFHSYGFGSDEEVANAIIAAGHKFDQLIFEQIGGSWLHISFDPRNRQQALSTKDGKNYVNGIVKL